MKPDEALSDYFCICLIKNAVSYVCNNQSFNNSEGGTETENRREGLRQAANTVRVWNLWPYFCPLMQVKIDDASNSYKK